MLSAFIKGSMILWPFIRENILGNKDIDYLSRKNRPISLMSLFCLILFMLFLYMTDSAIVNRSDLHRAKREIALLTQSVEAARLQMGMPKEHVVEIEKRISLLEDTNRIYRQQNEELVRINRELRLALKEENRIGSTTSDVAKRIKRIRELEESYE